MFCRTLVFLVTCSASAVAQVNCATPPTLLPLLTSPLSAALSGVARLRSVSMSGQAIRYSGRGGVSGTVTLQVSSSGSTQVSYNFGGVLTGEQSDDFSLDRSCTWTDKNGMRSPLPKNDCLQPAAWFLPYVNLISQTPISDSELVDEGLCTVAGSTSHRFHQGLNLKSTSSSAETLALLKTLTGSDLDVDPQTLLPSRFTYQSQALRPSDAVLTTEIRYSAYQVISGIQIPFHIQRYINGVLALDISITNVSLQ